MPRRQHLNLSTVQSPDRKSISHDDGISDAWITSGHALVADRADGEIDILQAEAVRGDELEREALGGKLRQSELAGSVAMAARAFHGDEFHREFLQREIRELGQFALGDDDAALALERLDAEQGSGW